MYMHQYPVEDSIADTLKTSMFNDEENGGVSRKTFYSCVMPAQECGELTSTLFVGKIDLLSTIIM